MIMMFFVITLTIFLFSSFQVSNRLMTINRVVVNTPIQLFETSIITIKYPDEKVLYFNKELLKTNLSKYYDDNLLKVFKNYQMELYYYNQENGSLCLSDQCNAVEVMIKGKYILDMDYLRSIKYEIHKGAKYVD